VTHASAEPALEAAPGRRRAAVWAWLAPVLVLLVTFGLYAGTAERHAVGNDAYASSVEAWRMTSAGTPWLDGLDVTSIKGVHSKIEQGRWLLPAANGHVVAQRMAGTVLASVPFYWVLGSDDTRITSFSLTPASLAAATWTAFTVMLMFLALRRRAGVPLALAGALTFGFATPTWAVSANGTWTHTLTQFGIAGAAYALGRRSWWLAGLFLAVGMLARPHLAIIAAVVGLGMAWSRREWRPALGVGVPTALSLVVLSSWNHWMFGSWSLTGGGYGGKAGAAVEGFAGSSEADVSSSQLLNYLGFFVSPGRGLFVWTPLLLLLLPALVRSWRSLPDWSRWLLVAGIAYSVVQLRIGYFGGGVSFYSYRYALELVTCAVPAFVLAAPRAGRVARWLAPPVIALQVAAISIGAINEAYFIKMERLWGENQFWIALRYQPSLVGTWTVLLLLVGVLVSVMLNRGRSADPATAVP
jgi:alpha-1,2-mannosyltransferase